MIRMAAGALALMLMGGATVNAADQPVYEPQPAWVRPVAIPTGKPSGAAADTLLWTIQDRLAPGDDESFVERAMRINAPEGLEQANKLILTWNPLTDTLAIHRARILRGSQVIDLLAGGRTFTVLRRETSLEAAMIDGELTATLQPEGVRVGDVIDLAYTLTRREPALAGHSEGGAFVAHKGSVGRLYVRASWPAGRPYSLWKTDDLPALTQVTRDGWTAVEIDQSDAVSPEPPSGAFSYDRLFGMFEATDFKNWADVSATAYPLYARAATLPPGSPLNAEIARIRAAHSDAKGRALAALQLVESQTRYLYVGLDAGGYTPAAADQTWVRRFGDCKGKTVLLLALLKGLDVTAEPALVHTTAGDGLDREAPEMGAFDHVIVHAVIDGRDYWLDGTRTGDEDLDILPTPNDHWALPVRQAGAELVPLRPKDPALPTAEQVLKVDLRGGLGQPAKVHEELIYRQDIGWAFSLIMKQATQTDRDRALRQAISQEYSWITPDKLAFSYDPRRMEARIVMDGVGKPPFDSSGGDPKGPQDWLIDSSYVAAGVDLTRTSDYHRQAPYQVPFPLYARALVEVQLPDGGRNFEVVNDDSINETVAGVAYNRSAAVNDGRFVMAVSSRSVTPSFPAAAAPAAEPKLRQLSEYPISLRYTPPETGSARAAGVAATEAGSPEQVAEAAFARRDYVAAEAAFTTAIAAHPSARNYYDRAAARAALGRRTAAREDLHAALALDPHHALALFALGRIALADGDMAGAARQFAAASTASQGSGDMLWRIAAAYQNTNHFAEAAPYYDRLMTADPLPAARDLLLNQRCWVRAQWGKELDGAQADCDEALRLKPGAPSYLDSRGLVELRAGALDKSIEDYTQALSKSPALSTSLFGRGLAEARLGRADAAKIDLAAAKRADPKVEAAFKSWGLSP